MGDFKKVGKMPTSPYSTRFIHCYYAMNCKKVGEQKLDRTEFIDVALLEQKEMENLLMAGASSSCAPAPPTTAPKIATKIVGMIPPDV
jgi:hypothetical protein